jgi:subtilisin-like proprotein convertase family protein
LVFIAVSLQPLVRAQVLPDRHVIEDRLRRCEFVVASNELHFGNGRQVRAVPPQAGAEGMRQHARAWRFLSGEEHDLVLYPAAGPRTERSRRLLTREVLVQLEDGTDLESVRAAAGGARMERVPYAAGMFLVSAAEPGGALILAATLRGVRGVAYAEPQLARRASRKAVPNDTLFALQWHLLNTGQGGATPGIDVKVTNVWNSWRGTNIVIGIVDDGMQFTHPDLVPKANTNIDWDFVGNDNDPSPNVSEDFHGTAVAGVAAAWGNNATGVVGAAFEATLVGLRLISTPTTDAQDAAAMAHSNAIIHIKNNSWGEADCDPVAILAGGGPLFRAAVRDGVLNGRGGRGVLYTWACGNGGDCDEDANYDGYANCIDVIAVAAVSDLGQQSDYSENGACVLVCAPSDSAGRQGIVTTDLTGNNGYNYIGASGELSDRDYTRHFGGTSSATPLVSGVLALVLQANPNLGHRDVKEIVLRSSTKVQAGDSDWKTNSAGIPHNHKYGAGMINASAAVTLATNWANLGTRTNITLLQTNLALAIPDNNTAGVTRSFTFTNAGFRVENVSVTMTAPHTFWGDLAVTLTSPGGMVSRLAGPHSCDDSYGYAAWPFSSVRHWGEQAAGTWTVKVSDEALLDTGMLNALEVTLHGTVPSPSVSLARTNGSARLDLRVAAPGWRYAIDKASSLTGSTNDWTQWTSVTVPSGGIVSVTDTNALAAAKRFYRARLLP